MYGSTVITGYALYAVAVGLTGSTVYGIYCCTLGLRGVVQTAAGSRYSCGSRCGIQIRHQQHDLITGRADAMSRGTHASRVLISTVCSR